MNDSANRMLRKVLFIMSCSVIAVIALCLFSLVVSTVSTSAVNSNDVRRRTSGKVEENESICNTEACKNLANTMLNNMDRNVEPCDDFFRHACGGFINRTVIPDDQPGSDFLSDTTETVFLQLKKTLEDEDRKALTPFKLAKNLYNQCMNTNAAEINGLKPLFQVLEQFGNWPVISGNSWDDKTFDWTKTYVNLHKAGYLDYLFGFFVVQNYKNNSRRFIDIDEPSFEVDKIYLKRGLNNSMVMGYYDFLVKSAILLGADSDFAATEIRESVKFEIQLANISLLPEQRQNMSLLYNVMSFSELKARYPNIRWNLIFKSFIPPGITISDDEVINVDVPSYLSGLEILLKETPSRVIANYLLSRVVADAAPYLNNDMRQIEFEWSSKKDGSTTRLPRWHECVKLVSANLPIALGSLYVRQHFSKEMKDYAVNIVDDLKRGMRNLLLSLDWMEEHTRRHALKKLSNMISQIAFPEELFNNSAIIEYYKDLKFSNKYVENVAMTNIFDKNKGLNLLRMPVDRNDWTRYAGVATVNAYYDQEVNVIWFPASIFQKNLFNKDLPGYLSYGKLGSIIGHEITHGFDNDGRQADENGNIIDWWDSVTANKFMERAKCMRDQYSNYTVKQINKNVNGQNTLSENIADNGGIRTALMAYNSYVEKLGVQEQKLPGIHWNGHQLFWLSFANLWCSKYTNASIENQVNIDFHSPSEFRVNGPLSNMLEFSDAFGCSSDTRMNATNKCRVW